MNLTNLNKEQLVELAQAVQVLEKKYKYNKALTYFTDTGRNSRDQYPVHIEFFTAGKTHNIRGFVGGNGTGKSTANGLESYYHLSGKYPNWWNGKKFNKPIDAWMCARENKNLREGIQELLFGGIGDDDIGSGIIAREDLVDDDDKLQVWAMSGTANCIGSCRVKHYTKGIFDGWSKVEFKTYAQGWKEYQGPTRQWITLDEEPDDVTIYAECLMRLRPKDGGEVGHLAAYFTPTQGISKTYLSFVPNGVCPQGEHIDNPNKFTVRVSARQVPHLPPEFIQSMIAELKISDPNNIEARIDGIAAMGAGLVYPVEESRLVCARQQIPVYWKKAYGMDPGQANFAMCWLAQDANTGIIYVYDEYKTSKHILYLLHAEAAKTRGDWIHGGIDPHEAVKPRDTGETVHSYFETQGLHLVEAKGDPDIMRMRIRAMMESGALRIMSNCTMLLNELRTYRFDPHDPNKIARNQDDHILDAMMYGICVFESISQSYAEFEQETYGQKGKHDSDDGRNQLTGY